MKLKKLTLLDFERDYFEEKYLSRLRSMAEKVDFVNEKNVIKRNEKIQESEALLVRYFTPLDQSALNSIPNLKYIGATSTAMDQLDVVYARAKGIEVTNLVDYGSNAIAEFVFGALIGHIRRLPEALKNIEKNDFSVHQEYRGWELAGKTFGIFGLGNIGKRVAEIALGFGMKIIYHSRQRKPETETEDIIYADLESVLATSDIVGVFLEFNKDTKGLITSKQLNLIKKGTLVISTGHTKIFDFPDLEKALEEGRFTFIQTYFSTIPDEHREALLKAPNTILYPSIAIQTVETKKLMQEMIVSNLEKFCEKRTL